VFSRAELELIAALCQRHDTLAITDEIYEHIIYGGARHLSIGSLPGMAERTITISGLSKTYSITGWQLAYAIACDRLTAAIRKVHDFLTVGAPHPLQEAGATALRLPESFYAELAAMYERKRARLFAALSGAGLKCRAPQGAYYIMADVGHLGFADDFAAADFMLDEVGVAAVPGSSFYHQAELGRRMLRFTFSKSRRHDRRGGAAAARPERQTGCAHPLEQKSVVKQTAADEYFSEQQHERERQQRRIEVAVGRDGGAAGPQDRADRRVEIPARGMGQLA
jgi:aspartate/methionine/tyrosine aminotransferase